ncbi:MAG: hypothetical protein NZ911_01230 [Sulfolobales archaeon]|nr:hypothetical protein [Sulfolobales archaeon]
MDLETDHSKFKEVLNSLTKEESITLNYFIRYRSVGELIALKELRALYGIQEPSKIINKLLYKGLIERGIGCYNVSSNLLKTLKECKTTLK